MKPIGCPAGPVDIDKAPTERSVSLAVYEFNVAGQKAYAKAGFKECGRLREHIWFAGRWWDEIHMDCLAHEFESPVLATAVTPD